MRLHQIEAELNGDSKFKPLQLTRPFFMPTSNTTTFPAFKPQISPFAKMVLHSSEIAYRCNRGAFKERDDTLLTHSRPYTDNTQSKGPSSSSFPSHSNLVKIPRAVDCFPEQYSVLAE